jgi:hypothetical protein
MLLIDLEHVSKDVGLIRCANILFFLKTHNRFSKDLSIDADRVKHLAQLSLFYQAYCPITMWPPGLLVLDKPLVAISARRAQLRAIRQALVELMNAELREWEEEAESNMDYLTHEFCERALARAGQRYHIARQLKLDELNLEAKKALAYWNKEFDTHGIHEFLVAPKTAARYI